jgi:hypothetical protein
MIGDESELRMPRRGREHVVRSLGSCFIALAAAVIVLGIVSLIGAFREAAKLGQFRTRRSAPLASWERRRAPPEESCHRGSRFAGDLYAATLRRAGAMTRRDDLVRPDYLFRHLMLDPNEV